MMLQRAPAILQVATPQNSHPSGLHYKQTLGKCSDQQQGSHYSTCRSTLVPTAIRGMTFGTRILNCGLCGPSWNRGRGLSGSPFLSSRLLKGTVVVRAVRPLKPSLALLRVGIPTNSWWPKGETKSLTQV